MSSSLLLVIKDINSTKHRTFVITNLIPLQLVTGTTGAGPLQEASDKIESRTEISGSDSQPSQVYLLRPRHQVSQAPRLLVRVISQSHFLHEIHTEPDKI